ncbi:MAG TPA: hypothetical protein PKH72_14450 [Rhodoferax sp.]|nr:hypothetical protein [Rhodoferax sp.]
MNRTQIYLTRLSKTWQMKLRENPRKYIQIIELVAQLQQIETPLKKKTPTAFAMGVLFIQLEYWLIPASDQNAWDS